jgi:hypothetical protein
MVSTHYLNRGKNYGLTMINKKQKAKKQKKQKQKQNKTKKMMLAFLSSAPVNCWHNQANANK